MARIADLHARTILDLEKLNAGQYFYVTAEPGVNIYSMAVTTYWPHSTIADMNTTFNAFLDGSRALGANVSTSILAEMNVNDALIQTDEVVAMSAVLGSRLFPRSVYENTPESIGPMYEDLLAAGNATDS